MSNRNTLAPRPAAIFAASVPTTPPPIITTLAGLTPATPPKRMPFPCCGFSKYFAPCWTDMRPATSDMGMSKGSLPSLSSTVS